MILDVKHIILHLCDQVLPFTELELKQLLACFHELLTHVLQSQVIFLDELPDHLEIGDYLCLIDNRLLTILTVILVGVL